MFYKQFLKVTETFNQDFVENFDYWLATLPSNNQKNITASVVSARLEVNYSLAKEILKYSEEEKILEKYYLVKCPNCDYSLGVITKDEIADYLQESTYCDDCDEDKNISIKDIYTAYKVVLKADVTEEDITRAIKEKLNEGRNKAKNFCEADSLENDTSTLYEAFYNPSESAYKKFDELRKALDEDYDCNTTAKGASLETLIVEIFKQIKHVKGTTEVKTQTNQFDCTLRVGMRTTYLSVFNYLAPYFIIECKNEKKKPDNTYVNKLESILATNEAKVGIVFGRINATKTCFQISREHYLVKGKIVITCCDEDLAYILDKRVNLLEYVEFKIFQVTANASNAKYEAFKEKKN